MESREADLVTSLPDLFGHSNALVVGRVLLSVRRAEAEERLRMQEQEAASARMSEQRERQLATQRETEAARNRATSDAQARRDRLEERAAAQRKQEEEERAAAWRRHRNEVVVPGSFEDVMTGLDEKLGPAKNESYGAALAQVVFRGSRACVCVRKSLFGFVLCVLDCELCGVWLIVSSVLCCVCLIVSSCTLVQCDFVLCCMYVCRGIACLYCMLQHVLACGLMCACSHVRADDDVDCH